MSVLLPVYVLQLHPACAGEGQCRVEFRGGFAANNADGFQAGIVTGCRRGIEVIGPGAAKSQQRVVIGLSGLNQVVLEFAPLVATELRVQQVVAFNPQADAGIIQQRTVQRLQRGIAWCGEDGVSNGSLVGLLSGDYVKHGGVFEIDDPVRVNPAADGRVADCRRGGKRLAEFVANLVHAGAATRHIERLNYNGFAGLYFFWRQLLQYGAGFLLHHQLNRGGRRWRLGIVLLGV